MLYEPKGFKTLEYNKIIDKLTEFAGSALAKRCAAICSHPRICTRFRLSEGDKRCPFRIYQKGAVSFRGVRDIRGSIKRLEIGAIIGINELLSICSLLDVCRQR